MLSFPRHIAPSSFTSKPPEQLQISSYAVSYINCREVLSRTKCTGKAAGNSALISLLDATTKYSTTLVASKPRSLNDRPVNMILKHFIEPDSMQEI